MVACVPIRRFITFTPQRRRRSGLVQFQGASRLDATIYHMPFGTGSRVRGGDKLTNERTMNIKDGFRELMSSLFMYDM